MIFIQYLKQKWNLQDLSPLHTLKHPHVFKGDFKGHPVVLKIATDRQAFLQEYEALKIYNGDHCVKCLDADDTQHALLLDGIMPGDTFKKFFPHQEKQFIYHVASILQALHKAPFANTQHIPTLKEWIRVLWEEDFQHHTFVSKAQKMAERLLETTLQTVLLHGDLHHENILFDEQRGFIAIDPKGILGDPTFDMGPLIRNPMPDILHIKNPHLFITERIDLLAEMMEMDPYRIKQWCYVQAVLSYLWALEDHIDPSLWMKMIYIVEKIL